MARKTIQVNEDVHARFSQLWKKVNRFEYSDSATGVLEWLMDFQDKYNTPEMRAALELVKLSEKRAEEKYGQMDISEAITWAQEIEKAQRGAAK